eukprot:m.15405 g.15405  ORF g.15405 m.15405 type:complete len:611 (+) comp4469_c0_seq2:136-1968(+)
MLHHHRQKLVVIVVCVSFLVYVVFYSGISKVLFKDSMRLVEVELKNNREEKAMAVAPRSSNAHSNDSNALAEMRLGLDNMEKKVNMAVDILIKLQHKHNNLTKEMEKHRLQFQSHKAELQLGNVGDQSKTFLEKFDMDALVHHIHKEFVERLNSELRITPKSLNAEGNGQLENDEEKLRAQDHARLMPGQIRYAEDFFCMDGYDANRLIVYMCNRDQPLQLWAYTPNQQIKLLSKNMCLDMTGLSEGDVMKLKACEISNPMQQFEIVPTNEPTWIVTSFVKAKSSDLCLTNPSYFGTDIASITLEKCNNLHRCRQTFVVNAFEETSTVNEVLSSHLKKQSPKMYSHERMNGLGGRILCWIMTNPKNHNDKAIAVKETWGRHCDKLVFVTTEGHPQLDTWIVDLPEQESRDMLWLKSIDAWQRAHRDHIREFDWFIRGDDDTFLLMDNVREYLEEFNPNEPHFFGRLFETKKGTAAGVKFYGGGSGTIVSKGALDKLVIASKTDNYVFPRTKTFADDLELGVSMARVGVPLQPQLDAQGRNLFLGIGINSERAAKKSEGGWYWEYSVETNEGNECCSNKWLGTHYITPMEMYVMEELHNNKCEGAGMDVNL